MKTNKLTQMSAITLHKPEVMKNYVVEAQNGQVYRLELVLSLNAQKYEPKCHNYHSQPKKQHLTYNQVDL